MLSIMHDNLKKNAAYETHRRAIIIILSENVNWYELKAAYAKFSLRKSNAR